MVGTLIQAAERFREEAAGAAAAAAAAAAEGSVAGGGGEAEQEAPPPLWMMQVSPIGYLLVEAAVSMLRAAAVSTIGDVLGRLQHQCSGGCRIKQCSGRL